MLKKVKTMLLDGCNIGESRSKIKYIDSLELCKANSLVINRRTTSSAFVGDIPCELKFFAVSLPRSLVTLSLANNDLSTESFPMDFSCLLMLKSLYLDGNPMDSMPSCVRTLPRLEMLCMRNCNKLKSVEHPPRTLRTLLVYSDGSPMVDKVVNKFVFDPEMSPLIVFSYRRRFAAPGSYAFEGMVKIQPIVDVEEKVLRSLGWTSDVLNDRRMGTNPWEFEIQMFYEFGIFSTIYEHEEMPSWFRHRSAGPSISFTIPSSPNNLRGLNFCSVHAYNCDTSCWFQNNHFPETPMTTISNVTKNYTWIYERHPGMHGRNCWVLLSHWMFGTNEMEGGDHVTITITLPYGELTKECGVSLVYDDGEEEEDALGYYKSWNHIIGGDLSPFQTITGEYILCNSRFFRPGICVEPYHYRFIADVHYFQEEEEETWFRALSPRKPDTM